MSIRIFYGIYFQAFILSFFVFASESAAQPVFTFADFSPLAGEAIRYDICFAQSPGAQGLNQVWDFSTHQDAGDCERRVDSIDNLPCYPDYPTSDYVIGPCDNYQVYRNSSSLLESLGTTSTAILSTQFQYSDPQIVYFYPMNYGDSISDQFYGVNSAGPIPQYRNGTCSSVFDGTGTLMTLGDTFYTVIRMHRSLFWLDSTQFTIDTFRYEYYYWYALGYKLPVAYYQSRKINNYSDSSLSLYQMTTTALPKHSACDHFVVFPNPADNVITLTNFHDEDEWQLAIFTCLGVRMLLIEGLKSEETLLTSDLPNGLYFFEFQNQEGFHVSRKVIVSH